MRKKPVKHPYSLATAHLDLAINTTKVLIYKYAERSRDAYVHHTMLEPTHVLTITSTSIKAVKQLIFLFDFLIIYDVFLL